MTVGRQNDRIGRVVDDSCKRFMVFQIAFAQHLMREEYGWIGRSCQIGFEPFQFLFGDVGQRLGSIVGPVEVDAVVVGNVLTINKDSTASMGVFHGIKEEYTSTEDGGIDLTVNGTMNVGFNSCSWRKSFAFWGNNVTVGKSGIINITDTNAYADMFIKRSLDNAGTISIATGNNLYMSDNSTLTLREGSDIRTNGVASQKDSVIYLQHGDYHYTDGVEKNGVTTTGTLANVRVILEADQKLGGFALRDGATLTIDLNENALALGGITVQNGEIFYLILDDFINKSLSVDEDKTFSLQDVQASYKTDDIDNYMYIDDLEWITENGRSYLYSASLAAIPEPAEWAMIFGAIALGFVAYRRRS